MSTMLAPLARKRYDTGVMTISAVLFDLGDTLWHMPNPPPVEEVRRETVRRLFDLLRSWGIDPDANKDLFYLGRDIRLGTEAQMREAYAGDLREPNYGEIALRVAEGKGLTITPEQGDELWATWNLGGPFFRRELFADAVETLEGLRERGYRLGCVTNRGFGGAAFVEEVEGHGLSEFFEVLSVSCDLGYMKPHPEIYRHALESMQIEPKETAMVGDSLRADVAGAQALGMTAVWRRRPRSREEPNGVQPDFVVDELRELLELPVFQ